jgi:cysteinyl-tRNA synthetase
MKIGLFSLLFLPLFTSFIPPKENNTIKAGLKMQDFVIKISKYAKDFDPNFAIIPQNGLDLVFNKIDPSEGLNEKYLNAIDGMGVEDLFFDKRLKTDSYRYSILKKVKDRKKIIVSDFITNDSDVEKVVAKTTEEGFLCFPRVNNNEFYKTIPSEIINENSNDIKLFSEAQNFLYLINGSEFKTKSDYIKAISNTNYDAIAIDLFFDDRPLTKVDLEQLKIKSNGGKRLVIAYINIGAAENWRYYWSGNWIVNDPVWIKKQYPGYENEFYVQFWHEDWQNIIFGNETSYFKKIIDAGFNGAYLDNTEAYYFLYNK